MSCPACERAAENPSERGLPNCEACSARTIAGLGLHLESVKLRTIQPRYRATLEHFAGENWKALHERVKVAWNKIEAHRRRHAPKPAGDPKADTKRKK